MLALPCCRCGGSVDWDGDAAWGASATGSEGGEAPSAEPPAVCGGGRERARSMSATVLVALGGGRRRARGADRRCGGARLLKAAEMRPNTSRSDARVRSAGGEADGDRSCRIVGSTEAPAPAGGEEGAGPGAAPPPPAGRDEGGPVAPPPGGAPTASVQAESAGGVGLGLFPPFGGWGDRGLAAPSPDSRCKFPPGPRD